MSQKTRVDLDLKMPVIFFKEEIVWKAEFFPNIESLQQKMNVLKTIYKK